MKQVKQVTLRNATHLSGVLYSAEAAKVGLQRGQWPDVLTTSLGNKQPLMRTQKPIRPRTWVVYEQAGGAVELQIFNE